LQRSPCRIYEIKCATILSDRLNFDGRAALKIRPAGHRGVARGRVFPKATFGFNAGTAARALMQIKEASAELFPSLA
jgi:hypothetical protein